MYNTSYIINVLSVEDILNLQNEINAMTVSELNDVRNNINKNIEAARMELVKHEEKLRIINAVSNGTSYLKDDAGRLIWKNNVTWGYYNTSATPASSQFNNGQNFLTQTPFPRHFDPANINNDI